MTLFMPETRGQPLEAIEEVFSRPVARRWGWTKNHLNEAASASIEHIVYANPSQTEIACEPEENAGEIAVLELSDFAQRPLC